MSKKGTKSAKQVRQYNTGDPVLAKMRGYPPWPGIIVDPGDVPQKVQDMQPPNKKATTYCILFFPQGDYGWLTSHDLSLLQRHEIEAFLADENKKRNGDLRQGYRIALDPAAWMAERAVTLTAIFEAEENAQVDQLASDAEDEEDDGEDAATADADADDAAADEDAEGEAMDLDVGLGLAEAKKGRKAKPAAAPGRKRKRESEPGESAAAGAGAAGAAKPVKAKKEKKEKAEQQPRAKKAQEKEKKPRRNGAGTKSKAVVESEDEGAHGPGDEDADAPAGSSKKVRDASPPPAKKTRRDREEEDESKSGDAQSVKVRDWRHKLQKTFLSNKGVPKSEAMAELDVLFTTVEQYDEMTIEQLQFSKIGKVMRHIAALDDNKMPPRDADFRFRARAKGLVDKWHRILNANKPGGGASGAGVTSPVSAGGKGAGAGKGLAGLGRGLNGEGDEEKDQTEGVEEAVENIDLNGKGADSPAVVPEAPVVPAFAEETPEAALASATGLDAEAETEPVVGGAADAEGEHDADANAEAEDASTHVEDVVMGEA